MDMAALALAMEHNPPILVLIFFKKIIFKGLKASNSGHLSIKVIRFFEL